MIPSLADSGWTESSDVQRGISLLRELSLRSSASRADREGLRPRAAATPEARRRRSWTAERHRCAPLSRAQREVGLRHGAGLLGALGGERARWRDDNPSAARTLRRRAYVETRLRPVRQPVRPPLHLRVLLHVHPYTTGIDQMFVSLLPFLEQRHLVEVKWVSLHRLQQQSASDIIVTTAPCFRADFLAADRARRQAEALADATDAPLELVPVYSIAGCLPDSSVIGKHLHTRRASGRLGPAQSTDPDAACLEPD